MLVPLSVLDTFFRDEAPFVRNKFSIDSTDTLDCFAQLLPWDSLRPVGTLKVASTRTYPEPSWGAVATKCFARDCGIELSRITSVMTLFAEYLLELADGLTNSTSESPTLDDLTNDMPQLAFRGDLLLIQSCACRLQCMDGLLQRGEVDVERGCRSNRFDPKGTRLSAGSQIIKRMHRLL